ADAVEDLDSGLNPDSPFRNAAATTVERKVSGRLNVAIGPKSDVPFLRSTIERIGRQQPQFAFDDATNRARQQVNNGNGQGNGGNGGGGGGGTGNFAPYGGGGGGFGGGPGYGGGFGGNWGELIGAGLGAWALSSAFGNDNNRNFPVQQTQQPFQQAQQPLPPTSPFFF
ncbi:MAG: hypothetical protein ACR2NP_15780, partial [Pirellulaceae bacterium]